MPTTSRGARTRAALLAASACLLAVATAERAEDCNAMLRDLVEYARADPLNAVAATLTVNNSSPTAASAVPYISLAAPGANRLEGGGAARYSTDGALPAMSGAVDRVGLRITPAPRPRGREPRPAPRIELVLESGGYAVVSGTATTCASGLALGTFSPQSVFSLSLRRTRSVVVQ
jgi:hypothetical protein